MIACILAVGLILAVALHASPLHTPCGLVNTGIVLGGAVGIGRIGFIVGQKLTAAARSQRERFIDSPLSEDEFNVIKGLIDRGEKLSKLGPYIKLNELSDDIKKGSSAWMEAKGRDWSIPDGEPRVGTQHIIDYLAYKAFNPNH